MVDEPLKADATTADTAGQDPTSQPQAKKKRSVSRKRRSAASPPAQVSAPPQGKKPPNNTGARQDPKKGQQKKKKKRPAITDLPPDRQAEIVGRRLANAAQRQHLYRPQIPEIEKVIELHTHQINILFKEHFVPCNEYAVAIDYVAKERLRDRAAFNGYLREFQEAIDELSREINHLYAVYEEQSNNGKTSKRPPHEIEASVQSHRSLQLLDLFKNSDDVIRMVQYLTIYGDLPERESTNAISTVEKAIRRCVKTLRNVKFRCFRRIVESEALRIAVNDTTSIADLEGARRIASLKGGSVNTVETKAKKAKQKAKRAPQIDPAAPASQPLVQPPAATEEAEGEEPADEPATPQATAAE